MPRTLNPGPASAGSVWHPEALANGQARQTVQRHREGSMRNLFRLRDLKLSGKGKQRAVREVRQAAIEIGPRMFFDRGGPYRHPLQGMLGQELSLGQQVLIRAGLVVLLQCLQTEPGQARQEQELQTDVVIRLLIQLLRLETKAAVPGAHLERLLLEDHTVVAK